MDRRRNMYYNNFNNGFKRQSGGFERSRFYQPARQRVMPQRRAYVNNPRRNRDNYGGFRNNGNFNNAGMVRRDNFGYRNNNNNNRNRNMSMNLNRNRNMNRNNNTNRNPVRRIVNRNGKNFVSLGKRRNTQPKRKQNNNNNNQNNNNNKLKRQEKRSVRKSLANKQRRKHDGLLYLSNLSADTVNEDIKKIFEAYGKFKRCAVFFDKETGQSKCEGVVQFTTNESSQRAIHDLQGKIFYIINQELI